MIDKHGIFIGLVNVPIGHEKPVKGVIKEIFKVYKHRLTEIGGENGNYSKELKELFKPEFYAIFGSFDIAIISKVDDLIFGYQKFNPNSECRGHDPKSRRTKGAPVIEGEEIKTFNYQVYNCTSTNNYTSCYTGSESDTLSGGTTKSNKKFDRYKRVIPENKDHLIAITSFKIKNSILIGSSIHLIEKIKSMIVNDIDAYNNYCEETGQKDKKIQFLLLDTMSWHEITLVLTSNCFVSLGNMIYRLREKEHANLEDSDEVIRNSLWWSKLINQNKSNSDSNVFSTSHTYFGVRYSSLENDRKFLALTEIINRSKGNLSCHSQLYTKPGYHEEETEDLTNILFNSGDIEITDSNQLIEMLKLYRGLLTNKKTREKDQFSHKVKYKQLVERFRKTKTIPRVKFDRSLFAFDDKKNKRKKKNSNYPNHIKEYLQKNLPIKVEEIGRINETLCKLHISKAVRQRVLKVFSNYNDAISDRQLYIYFIDLKSYVQNLIKYVDNLHKSGLTTYEVIETINIWATKFENAYSNRIQHSLRTIDLSEFNLEFNGGIQQVVSVYNFVFNVFRGAISYYDYEDSEITSYEQMDKLDYQSPTATYLTSASGVKSSQSSLQLNYYHITQPEILIVTFFKEAINFLPQYLAKSNYDNFNLLLSYIDNRDVLKINQTISSKLVKYEKDEELHEKMFVERKYKLLLKYFFEDDKKSSSHLQEDILNIIHDKINLRSDKEWLLLKMEPAGLLKYIDLINGELIHYIIVDYNNIKLYYDNNIELYSWWYWLLFFQEPEAYKTDGLTSTKTFLTAFFRYIMTCMLISYEVDKNNYISVCRGYVDIWLSVIEKNNEKNELFKKHKEQTFYICKLLFEAKLVCELLDFKAFIDQGVLNLSERILESNSNNKLNILNAKATIMFDAIFCDSKEIAKTYNDIVDKIKIQKEDISAVYFEIREIFMAYLFSLKKNFDQNNFEVERNNQTGQIEKTSRSERNRLVFSDPNGSIQIDKHGGLFVTGNKRATYFLAKNYLLKILMNYTIIYKIKLFPDEN